MPELILLLQAAATLAMVGLIWFVQIVHYPLFGHVGHDRFADYERQHQSRTTLVVAPLMLVEALTALLLIWIRPEGVTIWAAIVGASLLGLIWASTFYWQVPTHAKLQDSFNKSAHSWLVRSNWARTLAWSARGLLVCAMINQVLLRASTSGAADLATRSP